MKNKNKLPLAVWFRAIAARFPLIIVEPIPCHTIYPFVSAFIRRQLYQYAPPQPLRFPLVAALGVFCRVAYSLLFSPSPVCHLVMKRSTASTTPQYQLPLFLAAFGRGAVSNPNSKGELFVDPWWLGLP